MLEVDPVSRAARIQAGATGPELEAALRPHGFSLRFYPQSFEASTLGGWIATRAGGHFATLHTHIDELVQSVRALTPAGTWSSRRLPASGAGPSPDRLLLGSEGTLGVITEAWMRVQARPLWRASASVRFEGFDAGAAAVRALGQSGLWPSNCRLIDPDEARITGAADGALLVVGFESADHPLDAWLERALECCRDHGGEVAGDPRLSGPKVTGRELPRTAPTAGEARSCRPRTCATRWSRRGSSARRSRPRSAGTGSVTSSRTSASARRRRSGRRAARARSPAASAHAYPDGAAPYFTVLAPARRGSELEQWAAVKDAASEAIIAGGGTVTHHHAVGREHRPWYDRQRPEPFAAALRAAKRAVDPAGTLNPGVLVDPPGGG